METYYKYNKLFAVAENEKTIKLSDLHSLIPQLFDSNEKSEDECGNYSYENSTEKRLQDLTILLMERDISIKGNSNDYHNLAVDCAKHDDFDLACTIIERGLQKTPYSVDLLADMIRYRLDNGEYEKCEAPYQKLKSLDMSFWNWRAFSFSLDYLIAKPKVEKASLALSEEIIRCADSFTQKWGDDPQYADQAYFDCAMVDRECGSKKMAREIELLRKPMDNGYNAPKCALRLADIYFKSQKYKETLEMLQICAKNAFSPQPDINGGYTFLLTALTKATMLFDDQKKDKKRYDVNEINEIYKDFRTALKELDRQSVYAKTAHNAISVIETQFGVKYDEPDEYAF